MSYISYLPSRDFDRSVWFADPAERYEMRNDLVWRIWPGQRKADVAALLGTPEPGDTSRYWTYYLGTSVYGLGFAHHTLTVEFVDDKVINARVDLYPD